MKSEKNKTIDFSAEEGKEYLSRCIKVEQKIGVAEITNKTIFGNTNEVLPLLPNSFVDLLIADPPYNLEKNFHGNTFHTLKEQDYEEYTEKWISLIEPILKPNASIYVCCDWKCSSAIHRVLERHFTVMNRITWQREKGRGAMQNWKNGMEDIWFAVKSDNYTFNIDDVKTRRKVIAPYKDDGKPKDLVKRVIATEGQHIKIEDSKVYVDNKLLDEPYIHDNYTSGDIDMVIPEGEVFTMGDNREKSLDSRYEEVGLVNEKDIMGKVMIRLFPFNKIGPVK